MSNHFVPIAILLAAGLALGAPAVNAADGPVDEVTQAIEPVLSPQDPTPPGPPDVEAAAASLRDTLQGEQEEGGAAPGEGRSPGLGERLRGAFSDELWMAGLAGTLVTLLGLVGFSLVTRYVSPKEALKNPQRAMLYGFVRATPGAHLKQLSEEFNMKTSSILWHVRKLESADLVRSERANGFRVFYPVEGGIEVKRLSRAITALQNENARAIHELVERRPGVPVKEVAERLSVHPGTVRWHLRKLREFGCVEELVRDDGSLFYSTPLGKKALETMLGAPVSPATRNSNSTPTT